MKQQLIFLLVSCLLETSFGTEAIVQPIKDEMVPKNLGIFTGIQYQIVHKDSGSKDEALQSQGSGKKIGYDSFEGDSTTWAMALHKDRSSLKYGWSWYYIRTPQLKDDMRNNYMQCYNNEDDPNHYAYLYQEHDTLDMWRFVQMTNNQTNNTHSNVSSYRIINWGELSDHFNKLKVGNGAIRCEKYEANEDTSTETENEDDFQFIPVSQNYQKQVTIVSYNHTDANVMIQNSFYIGSVTLMNCGSSAITTTKQLSKTVQNHATITFPNNQSMGEGTSALAPGKVPILGKIKEQMNFDGEPQTVNSTTNLSQQLNVTVPPNTCVQLNATYTQSTYNITFSTLLQAKTEGSLLTKVDNWQDEAVDNTDAIDAIYKAGGATAQRQKDFDSKTAQYVMSGNMQITEGSNMVIQTQEVPCSCSSLEAQEGQLTVKEMNGLQEETVGKSVEDETAAITVSKPGFLFFH